MITDYEWERDWCKKLLGRHIKIQMLFKIQLWIKLRSSDLCYIDLNLNSTISNTDTHLIQYYNFSESVFKEKMFPVSQNTPTSCLLIFDLLIYNEQKYQPPMTTEIFKVHINLHTETKKFQKNQKLQGSKLWSPYAKSQLCIPLLDISLSLVVIFNKSHTYVLTISAHSSLVDLSNSNKIWRMRSRI